MGTAKYDVDEELAKAALAIQECMITAMKMGLLNEAEAQAHQAAMARAAQAVQPQGYENATIGTDNGVSTFTQTTTVMCGTEPSKIYGSLGPRDPEPPPACDARCKDVLPCRRPGCPNEARWHAREFRALMNGHQGQPMVGREWRYPWLHEQHFTPGTVDERVEERRRERLGKLPPLHVAARTRDLELIGTWARRVPGEQRGR